MSFYEDYLKSKDGVSPQKRQTKKDFVKNEEADVSFHRQTKADEKKANLPKKDFFSKEKPLITTPQTNRLAGKNFSNIQERDEMERRKFLEKIEGGNFPKNDINQKSSEYEEKMVVTLPPKPPKGTKIFVRIGFLTIIMLFALLIIVLVQKLV